MRYLVLLLSISYTLSAAAANMGGSWVLNERRSRFNGAISPGNVTLNIEHNEPKLRYTGSVVNPPEGAINDFSFDGAIDDKEYVVKEDKGERRVKFHRVNDRVIESVSQGGPEGEIRSRITLSHDGRTLERRMTAKGKDGRKREWIEIYEKK